MVNTTSYGAYHVSFTGDIRGSLQRAARSIADQYRDRGESILLARVPRDTNELAESCYVHVVPNREGDPQVIMGATADHAAPVEFGHLLRNGKFHPPNPFVRDSMSRLLRGAR